MIQSHSPAYADYGFFKDLGDNLIIMWYIGITKNGGGGLCKF